MGKVDHSRKKPPPPPVCIGPGVDPRTLPLLLSIPDTGFNLGVGWRHVYELVNAGLLDLVKVGGKASRITTESVLRLVAQRGKLAVVPGLKQHIPTGEASPKAKAAKSAPPAKGRRQAKTKQAGELEEANA